jgi:hypothetical protein
MADVDCPWEACWGGWTCAGGCTCETPWWCMGPPISIRGLFAMGGASDNPPVALTCDDDELPGEGATLDGKVAECRPGCKLGWRFWCTVDIEGPRSRPEVGRPPPDATAAIGIGSRR